MFRELKTAILIFIILTIITGILYPIFITGIAQAFFHTKANGSLIYRNEKLVGSSLIGQLFDDPKYFWGRISATSPRYNASYSSGSNIGPTNPALIDEIKMQINALKMADPDNINPIPVDLVTSSASGLDPHISLAAGYYQIPRISRVRGIPEDVIRNIVIRNTSGRFLGLIGEKVVNVLQANLDLDSYRK
ncbi:MAG: potassium-transporting ATPase subunit KdpC [Candidatus Omnitrophota bacterium]|jgi:K+-transporting ATPase ATPase C chain